MISVKSSMIHWLCLAVIILSSNTLCTEEEDVHEDWIDDIFDNFCILQREVEPKQDPRCKRFRWTHDDKIIGGETAEKVSSPWLASIQDLNFDDPVHFCGAVIISHFFLLTAAYCVVHYPEPYDKIKVVVGEHNLSLIDGWEVDLNIKNVTIHPDYNSDFFRFDVAIIEVKEEMYFNKRIQPIHLPHHRSDNIYKHFDTAKIYGWGKTIFSENPVAIKRKATIPLISFEDCQHTAYGDLIAPPTSCAGDLVHGGVASCTGDWGGPLVARFGKHDHELDENTNFLIGITSFSIGCGDPDTPNFYVDVRMILEWIHDNLIGNPHPHGAHPPVSN